MSSIEATCGIDVGTQGVRASVVSAAGVTLGAGAAPITSDHRDGRRHGQDPQQWWSALCSAVRDALAESGQVQITAVAIDATSGTVLVEHADGSPAGPALMYDDTRAHEFAERAQVTGEQLWSSLGYRIQPAWALPKIMWLQDAGALSSGDRVVHQSDHLVRRLVGSVVPTDTSHALKTGVDLGAAQWPTQIFEQLDIPLSILPEVALPATEVGTVSARAASETGLTKGAAVRLGMTDGCAAQIAAGALSDGHWSSALGTTLVVKGSTKELVLDPTGAVYCHRHPDGGWLPGGASSSGAGALRDAFTGGQDLDALTERAADLGVIGGATYPLVGSGERFPFVAPDATGFISDRADSDAAKFAAICQGIAYVERLSYDVLASLGADTSGPVSFTGGPTRNDWWNQLRCDLLGRPAQVPRQPHPSTGMAMLAAAAPGTLTETVASMVEIDRRYEPDAARGEQLLAGYGELVTVLRDRGWLDAKTAGYALRQAGGTTGE
ncbi:MAG: FGGY family carbohydrate kinase [Allobranchiibius sp.]